MRKHNWHPKIIEDYLMKYYRNIETRNTYRAYLKQFFRTIDKQPSSFIKLNPKTIENHIWDFAKQVEDKPKKSQSLVFTAVKLFLVRHDVDIKNRIWEDLKIRNNLKRSTTAITKKKTPTLQDLKKILSYSGVRSKALFTLLASSGLRIDEALNLTFNDIDMDERKITLIDEKAKFDIPRITFFTKEAKELLELWLPEREKMLNRRYKTSHFVRKQLHKQGYEVKRENVRNGQPRYEWRVYKDGKQLSKQEIIDMEKRIFPFDYVNARRLWVRLLEKTGHPFNEMDENPKLQNHKYLYNIHSLRRFFWSQMGTSRANPEYVNFIGGHMSQLDRTYKNWFDNDRIHQEIKEEYDKHMSCLTIFEAGPDLQEVSDNLKQKDEQIHDLQDTIREMKAEMLELRLEKLEKQNRK